MLSFNDKDTDYNKLDGNTIQQDNRLSFWERYKVYIVGTIITIITAIIITVIVVELSHNKSSTTTPPQVSEYTLSISSNSTITGYNYHTKGNTYYTAFKGIPYAQPPINNLRWKPPQSIALWNGHLDASNYSPICYQDKQTSTANQHQSEDCLYLNVFRPSDYTAGSKLPVMVWIYGGSFTSGAASFEYYIPQYLVNRGVIVVSLNYRLGIFGFTANHLLDDEAPNHTSGNYGLLDQRMAMQWIKDNIAAFGGDNNKITLFGESAGSISICFHIVSPITKYLYNQAILQSGPCNQPKIANPEPWSKKVAESISSYIFQGVFNCTTVDCMRELTAEQLFTYQNTTSQLLYGPVIDNIVVFDPDTAFKTGNYSKIPMIIGNVANEGTLFMNQTATASDYTSLIDKSFPLNATAIFKQYPLSNFNESAYYALSAVWGDYFFVCPGIELMKIQAANANVYYYWFNHIPSFRNGGLKLVYHFSDVLFMFFDVYGVLPTTSEEEVLANQMMDYWTSFAINGVPTSKNGISWPTAMSTSPNYSYMLLETPSLAIKTNVNSVNCAFWDSL